MALFDNLNPQILSLILGAADQGPRTAPNVANALQWSTEQAKTRRANQQTIQAMIDAQNNQQFPIDLVLAQKYFELFGPQGQLQNQQSQNLGTNMPGIVPSSPPPIPAPAPPVDMNSPEAIAQSERMGQLTVPDILLKAVSEKYNQPISNKTSLSPEGELAQSPSPKAGEQGIGSPPSPISQSPAAPQQDTTSKLIDFIRDVKANFEQGGNVVDAAAFMAKYPDIPADRAAAIIANMGNNRLSTAKFWVDKALQKADEINKKSQEFKAIDPTHDVYIGGKLVKSGSPKETGTVYNDLVAIYGKKQVEAMSPQERLEAHAKVEASKTKNTINDYQTFYRGFASQHPELKGGELDNAASQEWHKQKLAEGTAVARERGLAYAAGRPYSVIDTANNNKLMTIDGETLNKANTDEPGRYVLAGPGAAMPTLQRTAAFKEIQISSKQARDAINNLPEDFSQTQLAKFATLLQVSDDGTAIKNFLKSDIGKTLTGAEIDYATAVKNLRESAFALRGLSGMGQGSDMLREAIASVVPGPQTPNKAYALRSLDRFDTQVETLFKGVPTYGKGENNPGNIMKPGGEKAGLRNYNTPEEGLIAIPHLLLTDKNYKGKTVDEGMKIYSNNGYGGEIVPELKNKKFSDLTAQEMTRLTQAIIKREGNVQAQGALTKVLNGKTYIKQNGQWYEQ